MILGHDKIKSKNSTVQVAIRLEAGFKREINNDFIFSLRKIHFIDYYTFQSNNPWIRKGDT